MNAKLVVLATTLLSFQAPLVFSAVKVVNQVSTPLPSTETATPANIPALPTTISIPSDQATAPALPGAATAPEEAPASALQEDIVAIALAEITKSATTAQNALKHNAAQSATTPTPVRTEQNAAASNVSESAKTTPTPVRTEQSAAASNVSESAKTTPEAKTTPTPVRTEQSAAASNVSESAKPSEAAASPYEEYEKVQAERIESKRMTEIEELRAVISKMEPIPWWKRMLAYIHFPGFEGVRAQLDEAHKKAKQLKDLEARPEQIKKSQEGMAKMLAEAKAAGKSGMVTD